MPIVNGNYVPLTEVQVNDAVEAQNTLVGIPTQNQRNDAEKICGNGRTDHYNLNYLNIVFFVLTVILGTLLFMSKKKQIVAFFKKNVLIISFVSALIMLLVFVLIPLMFNGYQLKRIQQKLISQFIKVENVSLTGTYYTTWKICTDNVLHPSHKNMEIPLGQ